MRIIWATCGIIALCLGTVGIALPLLPTVPFLLLAAFCFAQSSPQLHHWLVSHPLFGPPIRDWQANGAIRKSAKIAATVSIGVVFGISVLLNIRLTILLIQAVILSAVLVFIWTRPVG
ncbi:YbaN family protein [Actibacterium sp. 188UL27-1]|uniref:YbaN family protein n=1 Tax=Actibacterium sp. 188UL27-1 TaxID=2786961 RepID=UPI0019585000|nr:YbaN family protein [Actibacterium sp. 188UL27-1]MBM7067275.1 YbaN family protein [Actibacterium sp. 188UL27-1]